MNKERLLAIVDSAIRYSFSRSAGAGGQNVNKVNTKVTARLPVSALFELGEQAVGRLTARLSGRMSATNEIVVQVQEERSQVRNREIALRRMQSLVVTALTEAKARRPTRPSKAARARRLEAKRRRSRTKQNRRFHDRPGE